jgi:hypothetical protein
MTRSPRRWLRQCGDWGQIWRHCWSSPSLTKSPEYKYGLQPQQQLDSCLAMPLGLVLDNRFGS